MQFQDNKSFTAHQNYWISLSLLFIGSMLLVALYMTYNEEYFLYGAYSTFIFFLYKFLGGKYIIRFLQNGFNTLKIIFLRTKEFSSDHSRTLVFIFGSLLTALFTWYIFYSGNYWIIFLLAFIIYIFYLIATHISEIVRFVITLLIILSVIFMIGIFSSDSSNDTNTSNVNVIKKEK
ncbi:MAG: hypothetical protein PHO27_06510 [Sulfuricurvum sp.]|nr:hypothetical protein [Sulfuricurvum sp.]